MAVFEYLNTGGKPTGFQTELTLIFR